MCVCAHLLQTPTREILRRNLGCKNEWVCWGSGARAWSQTITQKACRPANLKVHWASWASTTKTASVNICPGIFTFMFKNYLLFTRILTAFVCSFQNILSHQTETKGTRHQKATEMFRTSSSQTTNLCKTSECQLNLNDNRFGCLWPSNVFQEAITLKTDTSLRNSDEKEFQRFKAASVTSVLQFSG